MHGVRVSRVTLTPAVLAAALRPLSLTEDGTAAAILALEYGGAALRILPAPDQILPTGGHCTKASRSAGSIEPKRGILSLFSKVCQKQLAANKAYAQIVTATMQGATVCDAEAKYAAAWKKALKRQLEGLPGLR